MKSLLILDDHPIIADAVSTLIADTMKGWKPVRAASLGAAQILLKTNRISAAIVDLELPDSTGVATVERLRNTKPELKILVYCGGDVRNLAQQLELFNVSAVVSKGAKRLELARALSDLLEQNDADDELGDILTLRQREVLELVMAGDRNQDISATLGVSLETVKTHLRNILKASGCSNRTELAHWARQHLNS